MVGRLEEKRRLQKAADEAPQLVVMRGRRRVGKSFLLDQAYSDRRLLYFQADEGSEANHLDLLGQECQRLAGAPVSFDDWNSALEYLARLADREPLVVVLDEFQWMRQAQPLLPSIVMRHYDDWDRRKVPIALVVSGSALTLMEELLEGDKPMFGRAQYRPLIEPFDYRLAAEFGPAGTGAENKLRRYAILGGTAQYQVWAGAADLETIVKEHILAKDESLFEEPLQLIRGEAEIREPGSYYQILRVIAQGATQFSEIAGQSKISSAGVLDARLKRLAQLSYIELRETIGGNGAAHYAVSDPFFRFWFRYVYPNRSRLQRGRVNEVCAEILADLDNFMGPIFEQVCRHWAGTYASAEEFPASREVGAYWTRTHDVEVDVVGRTKSRYEALGSCKWASKADTHDLDRLYEHRDAVKGAGAVRLFIFARGFHPALVRRAAAEGVTLVSAQDLYA